MQRGRPLSERRGDSSCSARGAVYKNMLAFKEIGGMYLGPDDVERYDQIISVNRVCLSDELCLIKQNTMRKFSENLKSNEVVKMCQEVKIMSHNVRVQKKQKWRRGGVCCTVLHLLHEHQIPSGRQINKHGHCRAGEALRCSVRSLLTLFFPPAQ